MAEATALLFRVDREVRERLAELAQPGETANTVIRRILEMPERKQGRRSSVLKPFAEDGAEAA